MKQTTSPFAKVAWAPDGATGAFTESRVPTEFRLEQYFLGETQGQGVIHDRFGRLIGEATAEMNGFWQDGVFQLDEIFRYADGRLQERTWAIHIDGDGHYRISAPDMVGDGVGQVDANCLRMDYRLRVPAAGRTLALRFDDRMYLQGNDVLINTSTARKFGLVMARICFAFWRA